MPASHADADHVLCRSGLYTTSLAENVVPTARASVTGCSNGILGLFYGGSGAMDLVDYVVIETAGNAVKFETGSSRKGAGGCSGD